MNVERLVAILEDHDYSPREVEAGSELLISCSLCYDERSRLYVSADTGAWICFYCHRRGSLIGLLIELCGMSPNEALTIERSIRGGRTERARLPSLGSRRPVVPATLNLPPGFRTEVRPDGPGANYLRSRGIEPTQVPPFGYSLAGRYRYRVVVPVYTEGVLRTFVARTWLKDERKKVLMPKTGEGDQSVRALFGYDRPVHVDLPDSKIVLVEGVFDAMRLWQLGHNNVWATLGAHLTPEQRRLLKRKGFKNVVLLRDGDDAGRNAAAKEARELRAAFFRVHIAALPDGADPGSATPDEILVALAEAKPVGLDFGLESVKEVSL